MIAHSVRRVRRNHRAQWSSFLLRCVMKESSNSFVWILFSPFPSLRFPTYAFPPNWAVLRTVVKFLHAHPCGTELQCGTPGKMVQIVRGMTVWYFSFLLRLLKGKRWRVHRVASKWQDKNTWRLQKIVAILLMSNTVKSVSHYRKQI